MSESTSGAGLEQTGPDDLDRVRAKALVDFADEIDAQYPPSVFTPDGETKDSLSARALRHAASLARARAADLVSS